MNPQSKNIAILWSQAPQSGTIEVSEGKSSQSKFKIEGSAQPRLDVEVSQAMLQPGSFATRVTVATEENTFTFFLRDVNSAQPIYLPMYRTIVTTADDQRTYEQIIEDIQKQCFISKWQEIENAPEETYENACKENRDMICPAWLGLSRDMRIFAVEHDVQFGFWGYIEPRYHSKAVIWKELKDKPAHIKFMAGPGESCRVKIKRRLDEGVLPIVHSEQIEEGITYDITAFATLENQTLTQENLRGTDWQGAYPNTWGNMLTEEELKELAPTMKAEMEDRDESVICCVQVQATNTERTPRYAWYKGSHITMHSFDANAYEGIVDYDRESGWGMINENVYAVNRFNGQAQQDQEMSVLLQPGQTATWHLLVPHSPISKARAKKLEQIDFQQRLEECREFWRQKLNSGAKITVPEKAIDERIKAGLLHLDINTLGLGSKGPALATIGTYSPIGSESAPIIQFLDSMGWHDLAERALEFFLVRQREDGFIQNFNNYQLETGPALWTMGQHYRCTRDDAWVKRVEDNIVRACDYIIQWRNRNKTEQLRGKGYGLIDGKVADPDDFFRSFMLNALSYIGMQRSAEMLQNTNQEQAKRLRKEADEFREDIRKAFQESLQISPVMPLGDGTWCPTAATWTEYPGPLSLYAEGGSWTSHGSAVGRDNITGPLYLLIGEVFDAHEPEADMILRFQQLFTIKNTGTSQPYYARHDLAHIQRDEVKLFLKLYYNQMSGLQDRGTYAFWEHYHHASENKTHEEGWFLMQTRWMLYLEQDDCLQLLKAIPRKWMENGKEIRLDNVATHFGKLNLRVESHLERDNTIIAEISSDKKTLPSQVTIRLPHPIGRKAIDCSTGQYCSETETVRIENYTGSAKVKLSF